MTSCEDFLTAENRSSVTDVAQFSTKSGFESLVHDSYYNLRAIYTNLDRYNRCFNAGTDMYTTGRNNKGDAFHEYLSLDPDNGTIKDLYVNCYNGIRAAYQVPFYAASVAKFDDPDGLKEKRVDEARVIAAHYYYILVNSFGGVPLIKEFIQTPSQNGYPRASVAEVYDWIISELEDVVSRGKLEKTSQATNGGGRVTMEVAKAVLAQAYLSAAWDLEKSEYFAKAAQYAEEVIGGRKLTTEFADLWAADRSGDDNEEFIWDVEYDYGTAPEKVDKGNSWSAAYTCYLGAGEDPVKATNTNFVASLQALHNFVKGDKRYDVTFVKALPSVAAKNQYNTGYYTIYDESKPYHVERYYAAWYETEGDIAAWKAVDEPNRKDAYVIPLDAKTKEPTIMDGSDMDYDDALDQVFGGPCCKKFDDAVQKSTQGSNCWRDVHIITLPEMFFVAAEAYLQAGKADLAMGCINEVRHRAGLADLTTITLDDILTERSCEQFGNSKRWFDLRRTQKLVEYNEKYNTYVKENAESWVKTLRPIPQSAIDANPALGDDQNPGY